MRDDLDLTSELDEADDIVMGRDTPQAEIARLREHIDTDHRVMIQLGIVADSAVKMLEHVNMDTEQDRELHARAVGTLRGRLSELAAAMKEADGG